LCDYSLGCAALLAPIAERIEADALASAVVHSDDTPVAQRETGQRQTRTGRLWIYLGRERPDGAIAVAFRYTTNRSQEGPLAVLDGYRGYLQADAYSGYLNAERRCDALVWVACWAHARRYFEKVARKQHRYGRVHAVLKLIRALYQHETRLDNAGVCEPSDIAAARQRRSLAILDRLQRLLLRMRASLPPRSDLGVAVRYALNHWQALTRFCDDGRLELDNNRAERALRGVCVGRRNWTFVGSANGGDALATLLTIIETCKHNGVNPRAYLIDVLRRIQDHPVNRLDELVPYRWTPISNVGEA
jgi:transposase